MTQPTVDDAETSVALGKYVNLVRAKQVLVPHIVTEIAPILIIIPTTADNVGKHVAPATAVVVVDV